MKDLIEKIIPIEEHANTSINLLEIAKSYCDYNFDKGSEITTLSTVLDLVLKEQLALVNSLDNVVRG